jgi:hypothetical protein
MTAPHMHRGFRIFRPTYHPCYDWCAQHDDDEETCFYAASVQALYDEIAEWCGDFKVDGATVAT